MHADAGYSPAFKRTLALVWYAAVIGAAFQVNFFFWQGMALIIGGPAPEPRESFVRGCYLAAWCVIGGIAYHGRRTGRKPSSWAVMGMAIMVWLTLGALMLVPPP